MYQCVCLSIKFTISLRFGLFNIYLISTVNTVERKYMIIIGICNPWIPSLDSKEEGIVGKIEAGVEDLLPKSSVIQGATYTYSFSNYFCCNPSQALAYVCIHRKRCRNVRKLTDMVVQSSKA